MYELLLGPAFHQLPASLRALHRSPGAFRFNGECTVVRGRSLISRLFALAASLPPAGNTSVSIEIESSEKREVWRRQFGWHRMTSYLRVKDKQLHESLGPVRFVFQLSIDNNRVCWNLLDVRAAGLRIPRRLFGMDVSEHEQDGRYHFDVNVSIHGVGLLVHYSGWLS